MNWKNRLDSKKTFTWRKKMKKRKGIHAGLNFICKIWKKKFKFWRHSKEKCKMSNKLRNKLSMATWGFYKFWYCLLRVSKVYLVYLISFYSSYSLLAYTFYGVSYFFYIFSSFSFFSFFSFFSSFFTCSLAI